MNGFFSAHSPVAALDVPRVAFIFPVERCQATVSAKTVPVIPGCLRYPEAVEIVGVPAKD
jgi:hypothetical protein